METWRKVLVSKGSEIWTLMGMVGEGDLVERCLAGRAGSHRLEFGGYLHLLSLYGCSQCAVRGRSMQEARKKGGADGVYRSHEGREDRRGWIEGWCLRT